MAAIQYLVPGGAYVNEGTSQLEYLVPGGAYVDETSEAAAGATVTPTAGAAVLSGLAPTRVIGTVLTPAGMRKGT